VSAARSAEAKKVVKAAGLNQRMSEAQSANELQEDQESCCPAVCSTPG
jgi:hypothetical protein